MNPRELFESELTLIEGVIKSICRRHHFFDDEAEEFSSWVMLRLIANDYSVLRKFKSKSTLKTYLTTVIHRLSLDFRIQKWGKWRNSARARALGPEAVYLENLLYRDRYSLSEAVEIMRSNFKVAIAAEDLENLAQKLPQRRLHRAEDERVLEQIPSHGEPADRFVRDREQGTLSKKFETAIREAMRELAPEDRLILRMRFGDGLSVKIIAQALDLKAKPLYKRIERLLERLRKSLKNSNLATPDISAAIGDTGWDVEIDYAVE